MLIENLMASVRCDLHFSSIGSNVCASSSFFMQFFLLHLLAFFFFVCAHIALGSRARPSRAGFCARCVSSRAELARLDNELFRAEPARCPPLAPPSVPVT